MTFAVKNASRKEVSGSLRLMTGRSSRSSVMGSGSEEIFSLASDVESPPPLPAMERRKSYQRKRPGKTAAGPSTEAPRAAAAASADDSSFLRHLELEPADTVLTGPGRTPFTTTRRLTRKGGVGFGFSVAWTQPPRIERVEAGLPADRAGLRPGDYIIFVDKYNVVTMPEDEVLGLIRSCGNTLNLEMYRRVSPNGLVSGSGAASGFPAPASGAAAAPSPAPATAPARPATDCSGATSASLDLSRRRLHLPQVTFSSEIEPLNQEDARRQAVYQLMYKEQHFAGVLQFGVSRFLLPLSERKDLLSSNEHQTLFQNCEELLRLTEDILEQLVQDDAEQCAPGIGRVYLRKLNVLTNSYKRYLVGLKAADCLLVAKMRNQEFMRLVVEPTVPRRKPDLTTFLHKPLEHYRDILKLLQTILHQTKVTEDDYPILSKVVHELQLAYRDMATGTGLMEPDGDGRPLLSLQDLESRVVFTRCKPFALNSPGRQWIFGGDLTRVEGRSTRPFWALLFSDLLLLATVSRDRVLFVTEEPVPLLSVSQACFNIRKKATEFRLLLDGNAEGAASPAVGGCGPELSRHPKKNIRRRTIVLRAPTPELKAVWQNLIQRQIIYLNTARGGTPASSPLDSPDPPTTLSVGTLDSLSYKQQTPAVEGRSPANSRQQLDELIELRCRRLGKSGASKGSALHLAQWMRGQLGGAGGAMTPEDEPEPEVWSPETLRKRQPTIAVAGCSNTRLEELESSDTERSHSHSTSDSQVTVRSGGQEQTVSVCRQCHKTCLGNSRQSPPDISTLEDDTDCADNWGPLMLMGMSALNATVGLGSSVVTDPFSPTEVPLISVLPPTPDTLPQSDSFQWDDVDRGPTEATATNPSSSQMFGVRSEKHLVEDNVEVSPENSLHENQDLPYRSLSSAGLKRFGTQASLDIADVDVENVIEDITDSEEGTEWSGETDDHHTQSTVAQIHRVDSDYEIKPQPQLESITPPMRGWTSRASSFMAEKMSLIERLGENSRASSLLDRYLRPATEEQSQQAEMCTHELTATSSGEECETSGDDVWGTPTSGGDLDEESIFTAATGQHETPADSISIETAEEDTELMMDELLATPPLASTSSRSFPPRRRLEPLLEEEDTDIPSDTPSPEQGNMSGGVADGCLSAECANPATDEQSFFHQLRLQKVRSELHWAKTSKLTSN
ncbi:uncharacterized protein LOC126248203 [Schistocerca nitens]|uniref:uncharacterized protein LOC126248203 n=1 Tax=Schistocerca nitens TaxID=7011 RepID=UPI002117450A|nr:uncharacterized protein LOC126248203 [Schistocerca nitens]